MVTVDEFSRLVAGIYAAAVNPQHWEQAIRDVQHVLGGAHGALVLTDGASRSIRTGTLPIEAGKSYMEHYHRLDYVLTAVETGPLGVVRTGSQLTDPRQHREFHSDWARPYEGDDGLVVRLTDRPRPTCFLVGTRRGSEWFDTPDRVKLMDGLVVHLQQVLRTGDKLTALANNALGLAGALETVRYGVIIVGAGCRVINLNSAAETIVRADDGVQIRSGHITATSIHAEHHLHCAIHHALTTDGCDPRSGRSFTCDRPSGKRPYVIHVLPLHRANSDETLRQAIALVLIIDPHRAPDTPVELLRRLYGLTNTEGEVAVRIARGASLKQISEELVISLVTVRTHLQHVFDKTDTHRQGELIRLLLTLTP